MKAKLATLTLTALAGAFLVASAPALAGRDEMLVRQIEKTAAAKRAAQMELAKQQQQQAKTGLAGAVGKPGKVGPGTEERYVGRPARQSLADHP